MNATTIRSLENELRQRREELFREVAEVEADLDVIAQDRESELEERAGNERLARLLDRLDQRGKREIEDIDAALRRIDEGGYGACTGCGEPIAEARLKVLPATALCIDCARERDGQRKGIEVEPPPPSAPVPGDLNELSDLELEALARERIQQDERIDVEELRVVCRHGVVHLAGALPSEREHQILCQILTDVLGLRELDDRVRIEELSWEREDRSGRVVAESREDEGAAGETEDVVESIEEGIGYRPPTEPPEDET